MLTISNGVRKLLVAENKGTYMLKGARLLTIQNLNPNWVSKECCSEAKMGQFGCDRTIILHKATGTGRRCPTGGHQQRVLFSGKESRRQQSERMMVR